MSNPLEHLMQYDTKPTHGSICIVWRQDGKCEQVQIHGNEARLWRYCLTDETFCNVDEIVKWRGCAGLDF